MNDTAISTAAEERLLADLDTYTDWLGGECYQQGRVTLPFIPTDRSRIQELIDGMTVPHLVALSLYPSFAIAGAAMWELRQRYIAANAKTLSIYAAEAAADAAHDELLEQAHRKAVSRQFLAVPVTPSAFGGLA